MPKSDPYADPGARIGFTGTQKGMTALQRKSVLTLCSKIPRILEAHHGDCIGADEEFHQLIQGLRRDVPTTPAEAALDLASTQWYKIRETKKVVTRRLLDLPVIHIHPPEVQTKRAFCRGERVYVRKALPYLVRNRAIVDETDLLIACPKSETPEIRSGTWSTVRYAISRNHTVYMIFPDGRIKMRTSKGESFLDITKLKLANL